MEGLRKEGCPVCKQGCRTHGGVAELCVMLFHILLCYIVAQHSVSPEAREVKFAKSAALPHGKANKTTSSVSILMNLEIANRSHVELARARARARGMRAERRGCCKSRASHRIAQAMIGHPLLPSRVDSTMYNGEVGEAWTEISKDPLGNASCLGYPEFSIGAILCTRTERAEIVWMDWDGMGCGAVS